MPLIYVKLLRKCHVFEKGTVLELNDTLTEGVYEGKTLPGYALPDTGNGSPGLLPADAVEIIPAPEAEVWFGKCVLTQVRSFYPDEVHSTEEGENTWGIVKFEYVFIVHYPDCQQLYFHMPRYAWDADRLRLVWENDGTVVEDTPVRERLSGSTMLLWDTLPLRPGFYTLSASWPDGWTHQLRFIKFPEEHAEKEVQAAPLRQIPEGGNRYAGKSGDESDPSIPSGSGTIQQTPGNLSRHLSYEENGRSGQIMYKEGNLTLTFDWEFAGGNGVVIIFVPKPAHWQQHTGLPAERRQDVLEYVAERVIRDKASGCTYEISDDAIEILKK